MLDEVKTSSKSVIKMRKKFIITLTGLQEQIIDAFGSYLIRPVYNFFGI